MSRWVHDDKNQIVIEAYFEFAQHAGEHAFQMLKQAELASRPDSDAGKECGGEP
jgi:hypothetical protein